MNRKKVKEKIQTQVLRQSRRRCALCAGLSFDYEIKKGQIAHLDRNPENNEIENLCFLCMDHHDEYDSSRRQSKGLTKAELIQHRDELYKQMELGVPTSQKPLSGWLPTEDVVSHLSELSNSHSNAKVIYYDVHHLRFAERLARLFELAGWKVTFIKTAQGNQFPPYPEGIEIRGDSAAEVIRIVEVLQATGLSSVRSKIQPTKILATNPKYKHAISGVMVTIGYDVARA